MPPPGGRALHKYAARCEDFSVLRFLRVPMTPCQQRREPLHQRRSSPHQRRSSPHQRRSSPHQIRLSSSRPASALPPLLNVFDTLFDVNSSHLQQSQVQQPSRGVRRSNSNIVLGAASLSPAHSIVSMRRTRSSGALDVYVKQQHEQEEIVPNLCAHGGQLVPSAAATLASHGVVPVSLKELATKDLLPDSSFKQRSISMVNSIARKRRSSSEESTRTSCSGSSLGGSMAAKSFVTTNPPSRHRRKSRASFMRVNALRLALRAMRRSRPKSSARVAPAPPLKAPTVDEQLTQYWAKPTIDRQLTRVYMPNRSSTNRSTDLDSFRPSPLLLPTAASTEVPPAHCQPPAYQETPTHQETIMYFAAASLAELGPDRRGSSISVDEILQRRSVYAFSERVSSPRASRAGAVHGHVPGAWGSESPHPQCPESRVRVPTADSARAPWPGGVDG
jgi:hypothetical protein